MIKRIVINNYKSIQKELNIELDNHQTFLGLFGPTGSGKTTIMEAIYKFKEVFFGGMRAIDKIFDHENVYYRFDFLIKNETFTYEVNLNYERNEIILEKLTSLKLNHRYTYFIRDQYDITLSNSLEKLFTKDDYERFKIYLYDLKYDRREFILSHMRIKDFTESKKSKVLEKIVSLIKNIHIFNQNDDIKFFLDMDDSHYLKVIQILKKLEPTIKFINYKTILLDDLRFNLNRHRYDHLIDEFRNHVIKSDDESFFIECYNQFYKLNGRDFNDLVIKTVDVHFIDGKVISLNDLSKGLKRLIILVMLLFRPLKNDLFIIDDFNLNMDYHLTYKLIELIKNEFKQNSRRLIFSTHDMLLFDSKIFDLNEITYLKKEDSTLIYYMNKLGIRKDKKLLNLYLDNYF
ncbi:AAA family ATPase [Acholeplasma granularum]|uniref:AAA family ATPase n=1 Tax=Acholeplasma granularum TaxID=264635 RepID=UPI000471B6DF|nr:ATP-binding protein [Acholeplasma granularum]